MRHESGRYYARLYVGDKKKWVSFKTNLLSVAEARRKSEEEVNDNDNGYWDESTRMRIDAALAIGFLIAEKVEAAGSYFPELRRRN